MFKNKVVLVTGGVGYLGSVTVRRLLNEGYHVRVLDNLMYKVDTTRELLSNPKFEFIKGDIRDVETIKKAINGVDSVIHLAAIVGDIACAQREDMTMEINYVATLKMAELVSKYAEDAKKTVRFIYASTCSVYGIGKDIVNEQSPLNPVSLYAKTKIEAEKIVEFTNQYFVPCVMRFSTIYGLSPRMRFDLLINEFTLTSFREKKIEIYSGERWRPFIHIDDLARALKMCLEAPIPKIKAQTFNVGSDHENHDISKIGDYFEQQIPDMQVKFTEQKKDIRTYRVSFKKIKEGLGFQTEKSLDDGIREIYRSLQNGNFIDYSDQKYYNHIINSKSEKKQVVILAGGLGTRLKPFTEVMPKPLLPIGEKSILEIQISRLKKYGFKDIFLATGYKSQYFKSFFGDGSSLGVNLTISKEDKRLGTCGPLTLLKDKLTKPFIVMNGDVLSTIDFSKLYEFALGVDADLVVVTKHIRTPFDFGNVKTDGTFILDMEEKPVLHSEILAGIYVIKPRALKHIPENAYYGMDDLIKDMLKANKRIARYLMEEYWIDIGRVGDYKLAQHEYEKHFVDSEEA